MSVPQALTDGGTFAVRVPFKDNTLQYARPNGCKYEMVHLRNFAKDNLIDLLTQSGFEVERLHYDGFALWRARPYVARLHNRMSHTRPGDRVWSEVTQRLPSGPDGFLRVRPLVGRALTTPVVITAITRKAGSLA